MDVNATYDQERVERPMIVLLDLHFHKKFKLIKEKCEIPNK
ncbi:MAG: hypothetical protein ACXV4B_07355 [Halobacteriota archaeon]